MALTRDQKEAQLAELKQKMQESKSIIFTNYIGLTVADISDLRSKLKKEKAEMKVSKKTLLQIAAKELNMPAIEDKMIQGPVACIFSNNDPTSGANVAFQFAKTHDQVKLIGGMFDGKILSAAEATTFATLPNRMTLLATFMMMINSPLTKFAGAVSSPLTGFARALSEVAKKKEATPA